MPRGRCNPALSLFVAFALPLAAQQYPAEMLSGLQWRDVGPMRGGRTYAVSGNAAQPDTFYMGSVGGGVWKTENSGRTWFPIADDPATGIPIGSIGAIAVAPSDPNIVYVGTGEPDIRSQHSYGIGLFKSTDAGKTWHSIGLAETRQIGKIVVDPADPNRVYVAALGHAYKANPERGVYRSTDGGAHWKKILVTAKDPDDVGAVDLALDPQHPRTIYASLWATRRPPWAVYAPSNMPGGGLYKSTDGGDTWHQLSGGLPDRRLRRQDRHRRCAQQSQSALCSRRRSRHGDCAVVSRSCDSPGTDCTQTLRRNLCLRRCRRNMAAGQQRTAPVGTRMVLRPDRGRSRQSRSRLRHQHSDLHDARCGQDLGSRKRRSRRRRLSPAMDQSKRRKSHGALQRSGHRRFGRRRKDLEHLVQPAHRADLSYRRRQPLSLLALRRATGLRCGRRQHLVAHGHAQLPQLGTNLRGGREQHRCARSQRRQPALWQWRSALQSGAQSSRACRRRTACSRSRAIPTAEPGLCRRSFHRPTTRSTIPINLSSARAIAAKHG